MKIKFISAHISKHIAYGVRDWRGGVRNGAHASADCSKRGAVSASRHEGWSKPHKNSICHWWKKTCLIAQVLRGFRSKPTKANNTKYFMSISGIPASVMLLGWLYMENENIASPCPLVIACMLINNKYCSASGSFPIHNDKQVDDEWITSGSGWMRARVWAAHWDLAEISDMMALLNSSGINVYEY